MRATTKTKLLGNQHASVTYTTIYIHMYVCVYVGMNIYNTIPN